MGTSRHVWTAEGFLLDDLFNGTGIGGIVYADRHLVVSRTVKPFGLRFAGEIDLSNSGAVGQAIRAAMRGGEPPHLDLSRLSFCDVSGTKELMSVVNELGEGGRLLLHGLPAQLLTLMRVMGWSTLPGLVLCSCGDSR